MSVLVAAQELTFGHAVGAWQVEPVGIAVTAVAGAFYAVGLHRVHGRGLHWPVWRTLVFVVGLIALLVATVGWIGVYATSLFWVYTVQFLVLLLLAPLLLVFGRPLALARLAWPDRPTAPTLLARIDNPLVGPALLPVLAGVVFFTPLLTWSLQYGAVGALLRVVLVLAGVVFALPLAGEGRSHGSVAIAAAVFVGFIELLADAIPGIAVRLHTGLLTTYFAGLHRGWGQSPIDDQHRGGSILWVVAEVVDLPFLALLFVQWIRADEQEAARMDEQLDAVERARPAAAAPEPARIGEGADDLGDGRVRPWWETNGEVLGSARAARLRRSRDPQDGR